MKKIPKLKKYLALLFVVSLGGCGQYPSIELARKYAAGSKADFARAEATYRALVNKAGKTASHLRLELGTLYFEHSRFDQALAELKSLNFPGAQKLAGISAYRLGDFVFALQILRKLPGTDPEALYYYGRTAENLNLFDEALAAYRRIGRSSFAQSASSRIAQIQRLEAGKIDKVDARVAGIIARAGGLEKRYPQAGALILYCDEQIEVTPQDTQVSRLHYVVKVLNDRGKNDFAETSTDYDSTYEKVELEYARTIKPDGSVVNVGTRHIRDVSKYLNFPLYSNARVFIISFPEITEGAVIDYKLKVTRSQLIDKKEFILAYPWQGSNPIIRANLKVRLPQARELRLKELNAEYASSGAQFAPKTEVSSGLRLYSWEFNDIPQVLPENAMPPYVGINPTILMSTFSSWERICSWWWELARDKIASSPEIRDLVKTLAAGKTEREKAAAIYDFVSRQIRYVAVEYGEAGYEPHKAEDILRNKYGDCKDQAVLLTAMLKEAGLRAFPVLIPTRDYYDLIPGFPAVLFDHCIACVELDGKTVFMDPTAQTCSFGDLPGADQDRGVIIVTGTGAPRIERTPLFPAAHNLARQTVTIKVNPDETILVRRSILTTGIYDQAQRYWLTYTAPEMIEETLREKAQGASVGAELLGHRIDNLDDPGKPVILSYDFRGPEYFVSAGDLRIMPQLADLDASLVARASRKYPLDLQSPDTRETIIEVAIPESFAVQYIPETIEESSPWFDFRAEYSFVKGILKFHQIMHCSTSLIPKGEYADFKSRYEALAKKVRQRVVLQKNAK